MAKTRVFVTAGDDGGAATTYLELDAAKLEPADRPLLGLLSPAYLADGGFAEVLREARDYGAELRERLDRALRERVLPVLGRELGRWAEDEGRSLDDDAVRAELEAASLTFVFRALFLLYAESAGFLPMDHHAYAQRSFTRIAERAAEELDSADRRATSLWRDIGSLVEAMRTGQSAWGVPAYNGALFAPDGFDGAELLERASIPDRALDPAPVALARDRERSGLGVDFSGLAIGHLGHIYEGLLSLRLTVADRDYCYDARKDRYRPAEGGDGEEPAVRAGELFWLTNEGGRKGGGVYYTRSELVRHLVRRSVRPAFASHLEEVRELAGRDPGAAAARLFDFAVIDPSCGSAHFLVEVLDELADQLATLLGDVALPALRDELDSLRATAGGALGGRVEDTALLKRLVLKRCVYGVDLSPMGAEIAKVSLWLGAFVPGLSLAYLDHNIRVGNFADRGREAGVDRSAGRRRTDRALRRRAGRGDPPSGREGLDAEGDRRADRSSATRASPPRWTATSSTQPMQPSRSNAAPPFAAPSVRSRTASPPLRSPATLPPQRSSSSSTISVFAPSILHRFRRGSALTTSASSAGWSCCPRPEAGVRAKQKKGWLTTDAKMGAARRQPPKPGVIVVDASVLAPAVADGGADGALRVSGCAGSGLPRRSSWTSRSSRRCDGPGGDLAAAALAGENHDCGQDQAVVNDCACGPRRKA